MLWLIAIPETLNAREEGLASIRAVRERLSHTFGLNVVGAHDALETINAWLVSIGF